VGIGPVFGSDSKNDAGTAIGVDGFKRLAALVPHPAVAVGGITADRALQITVNGAIGVAVINAIFSADDPETATREIAAAIGT
jgi:thiamine-phosphate pyrophosphorylase